MHVELPEKMYYSIGEIAKAFNVNTSLIRFWDKEFDCINPRKNRKGNRMFRPADVQKIELIYHLVKEQGYTIDGARKKMNEQPKKTESNFEVIKRLQGIKAELLKIKNTL